MTAGRFLSLTARYRASSAILFYSGTGLMRLLRAPRGLMGLCPGRPVLNAAWARLAAAAVRVAVRPPACPLRPRSQGGALAWRAPPAARTHLPDRQTRPPIMIACESTNMAPPRSSGARACCFGVPWPTQRLPRAAERQAAGECARSAGPGPAASCALSCQCQPSPVRLAPVRGLDQPRTRRPTEHRPLRARRALGA